MDYKLIRWCPFGHEYRLFYARNHNLTFWYASMVYTPKNPGAYHGHILAVVED